MRARLLAGAVWARRTGAHTVGLAANSQLGKNTGSRCEAGGGRGGEQWAPVAQARRAMMEVVKQIGAAPCEMRQRDE